MEDGKWLEKPSMTLCSILQKLILRWEGGAGAGRKREIEKRRERKSRRNGDVRRTREREEGYGRDEEDCRENRRRERGGGRGGPERRRKRKACRVFSILKPCCQLVVWLMLPPLFLKICILSGKQLCRPLSLFLSLRKKDPTFKKGLLKLCTLFQERTLFVAICDAMGRERNLKSYRVAGIKFSSIFLPHSLLLSPLPLSLSLLSHSLPLPLFLCQIALQWLRNSDCMPQRERGRMGEWRNTNVIAIKESGLRNRFGVVTWCNNHRERVRELGDKRRVSEVVGEIENREGGGGEERERGIAKRKEELENNNAVEHKKSVSLRWRNIQNAIAFSAFFHAS